MNEEVEVMIDGKQFLAEYAVFNDTLVIYFPDGSTSEVELRGLKVESTAKRYLRNFINKSNA
ncbi:hypothetical protein ACV0LO_003273 [Vibrio cholerae]